MNWYLMVASYQVDLGEDACTCKFRGKVLNVGNWVAVRRCDVIESTVVATTVSMSLAPSLAPCAMERSTGYSRAERCLDPVNLRIRVLRLLVYLELNGDTWRAPVDQS